MLRSCVLLEVTERIIGRSCRTPDSPRQQADKLAVAAVSQHIQQPVGALSHIADAADTLDQFCFLAYFSAKRFGQFEPGQVGNFERADKQIAAPRLAVFVAAQKRAELENFGFWLKMTLTFSSLALSTLSVARASAVLLPRVRTPGAGSE